MTRRWRIAIAVLAALAGLGVLAYLPTVFLPFMSDDYSHIAAARQYAPVSGWDDLAQDPVYRCRTTSHFLTYWTERLFGLNPVAFNWSTLLLHLVNTWLVFALGMWRAVGWRVSAVAAGFFAVSERHQEAVVWYAALPELLVFFFSLLTILCWIAWLRAGATHQGIYAASLVAFLLAMLSKESGVIVVALLALVLVVERVAWRRMALMLAPFAFLALLYAGTIFGSSQDNFFFGDGTFSPGGQFLRVLPNSYLRLMWIWGGLGLAMAWLWRTGRHKWLLAMALAWMAIALIPYSFLDYMPGVPSRHTYLASLGLSLVVGKGLLSVYRHYMGGRRWWAVYAVALVILAHNVGYLWTRKHAQYEERAAPTEALIEMVTEHKGPVYVHCFPYGEDVARKAVEVGAGLPPSLVVWDIDPAGACDSGFSLSRNPHGNDTRDAPASLIVVSRSRNAGAGQGAVPDRLAASSDP
jgi:hypothetical protein